MTTTQEEEIRMGWERAWDERLEQIDNLIIAFVRRCGELNADRLQRLTDELRLWFDQQVPHLSYDPAWQRAKSDPQVLQGRIEERFSHLLHGNRLCLSVVESPVVEE